MSPRIGLYGGAFDPPHRAHRALASAFARQFSLDALHVVPTGGAYHRAQAPSAAAHRLAMARLNFEPPAVVDDLEIQRTGPSYTIDTVEALKARYAQDSQLFVLIGEDQWARIDGWHRIDELMQIATFVVAKRPAFTTTYAQKSSKSDRERRLETLDWQAQHVSSTAIRAAAARGDTIDGWVEPAVARYIADHQLYRSNSSR